MSCFRADPLTSEQSQLAAANLGLVGTTVRLLMGTGGISLLGWEDAIGEGLLALVKAARGFRPLRQKKFSSYAITAIRTEVRRAARRWRERSYSLSRIHEVNLLLARRYGGDRTEERC